jgi:1-phosphatidylinositol-4-phosphate 5-kinase
MTNMLYSIQTINFAKKKEEVFILKEFAGIIFNNIRLYLGFDKDDFIASISPQDFITELMISNQTIFEELCSTGRSGSLFYYTRDGKFIVKTIKKDEYKFIKQILPDYFKHLKTYPLSLLPKFLGCYVLTRKIKKKRDKIYFIVMLNVFATSKHIHIRYDLKGSRVGRRVLTGKRDAEIMAKGDLALKDLDLEKRKEKMYIGEKNDILLKQIKNDADFLCKIEANDYSLLLGIHYINKEKKNKKFSSTNIIRDKTNIDDSILKESSLSDKSCDSRQEKLKALIDFEDGGIISETGNEVYFVGIIDILTKFNWKKKM